MKTLLSLLLSVATLCWGTVRTVNGPIYTPSGGLASGTITVENITFTASDGTLVGANRRTFVVSSGVFTGNAFQSTQDASPSGLTYKVTYRLGSAAPAVCYWSIPAGSSAVLIADIQTCSPPSAPIGTIALSQLSIGGGSAGQCLIISGGIWAPDTCPSVAGFTAGSVIFTNSTPAFAQDNSNFFWNDSTNRLGIGTNSPSYGLHVASDGYFGGNLTANAALFVNGGGVFSTTPINVTTYMVWGSNSTPGACNNSTYRGAWIFTAGGAGVADTLQICRKKADDTYSWSSIALP